MKEAFLKVLVCGQREFPDEDYVYRRLDRLHRKFTFIEVIEGECPDSPDVMAREWAIAMKIPFKPFPADWNIHGKSAGPIRNKQMLDEGQPDLVVAFIHKLKTSRGTIDMMKQARDRKIEVIDYNIEEYHRGLKGI